MNLPGALPNIWEIAVTFATKHEETAIPASEAKVLIENLQELDAAAFKTDIKLLQEFMSFQVRNPSPLD